MKQIILVDIDDVLCPTVASLIKALNKRYKLSVDPLSVTTWDLKPYFPDLTEKEIFAPLDTEEFWENISPRYFASEVLKKLNDDGFEIYFCTATHYNNVKMKYEKFVKKYFPFIDWQHIIVCSNKNLVKCDIIIDDALHNLQRNDCARIVFDMPHNKSFQESPLDLSFRADDWEEIYKIINIFLKVD